MAHYLVAAYSQLGTRVAGDYSYTGTRCHEVPVRARATLRRESLALRRNDNLRGAYYTNVFSPVMSPAIKLQRIR
jgi:hypothetical protein